MQKLKLYKQKTNTLILRGHYILGILFLFSSVSYGQMSSPYPNALDMYKTVEQQKTKRMSKDQKMVAAQAQMIKSTFLKPFFDLQKNTLFADGGQEYMVGHESFEMCNEILIDELAKKLAKQDILQFKKLMKKHNKTKTMPTKQPSQFYNQQSNMEYSK